MTNNASEYPDFESVKTRLDQIVAAVSDDDISLDDALDLYEEAVALGMRASDLLEEGITVAEDAPADGETAGSEDGDAAVADVVEAGESAESAAE